MDPKYHFTHLKSKCFNILTNKEALDYLMKWSIKGQLKLITFSFNEPFQNYQMGVLLEDFFKDPAVTALLNQMLPCWHYTKDMIQKVESEATRCTVSSLSFFDRLLNVTNNVVTAEGYIRHCLDDVIDGFMVADELRKVFTYFALSFLPLYLDVEQRSALVRIQQNLEMLLDEEGDNYGLFSESDRGELIFKVFQFLVLGGQWCQYEDKIAPYLDLTKVLYKDLLRVERNPETKEIEIRSVCHKIKLIGTNGVPIFPTDSDHLQNFVYVIIDPTFRHLTLFAHQFGGQF